jgi:cytochrome c556
MRPASHHDRLFNLRCLASAIAIGAAIFVANAQGPGQPPPSGGGDTGGPPVPPGAKEGDGDFGGAGKSGRRQGGAAGGAARERMQSGRAWMMTWNEYKGTLSPEQLEKAEKIQKEFEAKMKTWQEANAEQLKSLREQIEGAMQGGGRPDPAVMQEMQKLNESRPKVEDSHKQLFALLSAEQQDSFKKKLAETEAKMKERAKGGEGGPGGPGGKGGKGGGKGGKPGGPPPPPKDGEGAPPPPPMDQ